MTTVRALEWIVRRVPPRPKYKSTARLRKLSKAALIERCWAAEANDDCSMDVASEAWARIAELVEMLEGKRPVDRKLLESLKEHRAHVVKCRMGSCEHEYAALVRADLYLTASEGGALLVPRSGCSK